MPKIIIVGGGAAGFFAAIVAAELSPFFQVILLEAGAEPLGKVRISGGGRCNVTHACFDLATLVQYYPRGGKALRGAFSRFQPQDTIAWFAQRGVELKTEGDGRLFPTTDDSETIVHCLRRSAAEAGVEVRVRCPVVAVDPPEIPLSSRFRVQLRDGTTLESDRLLLATGSSPVGYRIAAQLGHTIVSPVPSLFTFQIADGVGVPSLKSLAGISVSGVALRLEIPKGVDHREILTQTGDVLITHWGLSGPGILKLSAWGARLLHDAEYQAQLHIHWCHPTSPEAVRECLVQLKQEAARKQLANYRPLNLPQRLWHYLLSAHNIDGEKRWADVSKMELQRLTQGLTHSTYSVQGKGVFKDEFVTCGGVDLKNVNFKTMESRICPGLYFAGEILDIDGVTGGFNFQSAWTTGWLAAQGITG